jgi:hypothetical protein
MSAFGGNRELSLFIGTSTTLLAIINPFEVLPVYLKLLEGKDVGTHRRVAWKSCVYALLLSLFFLIFGTLILRLFGVLLSILCSSRLQIKAIRFRHGHGTCPHRGHSTPACRRFGAAKRPSS